jgi:DNA-binding MarR family transcriptional regulator
MFEAAPLENEVGYELKRAQHALRLRLDEALGGLGLTAPQYAVLAALRAEPGLSGAELARRGFVTPQTMNGVLTSLEERGLVERRAHPVHGRILQAHLTAEGGELAEQADRKAERVNRRMLSGLSTEERRRFLAALRDCASALEQ